MALPSACSLQSVTLRNTTNERQFVEGGYWLEPDGDAGDELEIDMSGMSIYLKERLRTAFTNADAGGLVVIEESDPPEV